MAQLKVRSRSMSNFKRDTMDIFNDPILIQKDRNNSVEVSFDVNSNCFIFRFERAIAIYPKAGNSIEVKVLEF